MMSQPECISREQLERYVLGDLPATDWQAVATHLETCERCEETVSQLDRAEDTLVKTLRGPAAVQDEPSTYRLAARRAKAALLKEAREPRAPRVATQYLRDYELIEPIARGGMGMVYRAVHQRLRRDVAVKILPQRCLTNPLDVARFQREMQAVGQLRHPGIVQATDGGEVDGVHFLVMELVEGVDLNTLVKCSGPLPPADACELARRTALGLAYAHQQGVIHRDVKPSNVMLTAEGEIKILDLGLARMVGEQLVCDELTTIGQLMGTVDYMAPEQFENSHDADERCDVYGLGATLFKLLAGQVPYGRAAGRPDSPLVKLRRIAAEPPPPLSSKRGDLPTDLCSLVDRMIARCAADRPASMQEVASALAPWCAGHNLRDLARNGMAKQAIASRRQKESRSEQVDMARDHGVPPMKHANAIADPGVSNPPPGRLRRTIVALMFFTILAALGIVITLQTTNGQLVIETSVPDVEVRIVRAGQPYKTLTLTQQPNSLRLGSGDYEIQLVGPADGLRVENNTFTLTRGKTVVARVVHTTETAAAAPATAIGELSTAPLPEPRYDGKSTAEWTAVLLEDRSPGRVVTALDALQKLGVDRNTAEVVKAVFHAVQFHNEFTTVPSRSGDGTRVFWESAAATLGSFDKAAVASHVSVVLDDPAYRGKPFVFFFLNKSHGPFVSERLLNQLIHFSREGTESDRSAAISAIARTLGTDNPKFVEICRAWLADRDIFLRLHAANRLIAAKQATQEVVTTLRQVLKEESANIRTEVIATLQEMGADAKPAVPDLIGIVERPEEPTTESQSRSGIVPDRRLRQSPPEQAIAALGKIGDASALPVLIREWKPFATLDPRQRPDRKVTERRANLQSAIEALTGARFDSSGSSDGTAPRAGGWRYDGRLLSQWTGDFVQHAAGSSERQNAANVITKLLQVSSESDVELAVTRSLGRIEVQPAMSRLPELLEFLRPNLPAANEVRAMLVSIGDRASRGLDFDGLTQELKGKNEGLRFVQQLLKERASSSPELRKLTFNMLAEFIERDGDFVFVVYVDTLVDLGVPDPEVSKRMTAAFEKARESKGSVKAAAANRGREHLLGKPEEPKPESKP